MKPNSRVGRAWSRPVAGLLTVLIVGLAVAMVAVMFRGDLNSSVPVTVMSPRAGLVMNPDAKVKLRGVQVGAVKSLETLPNGRAVLHLAMDPAQLQQIPANVGVDIASTTVFGAKYVQLIDPADPSPQTMVPGQVLDASRVTVEVNTVFEQLSAVLSTIDPAKLNQTLGAIGTAVNGRGQSIGQMLVDLDTYLATLEPGLPALSHDLATAPPVLNAYADAAPGLLTAADNANKISQSIVDEQRNLDAFLVSMIGLADVGTDVLTTNRAQLTDAVHLLAPTTDLTGQYNQALYCLMGGLIQAAYIKQPQVPGAMVNAGFVLGKERYRYPIDLPKVAATGGPQCVSGLPNVRYLSRPPFVIADVGTNPARYGNEGVLLNSAGLKQMLFGPIAGPPRNSAQIGQPG
ncbi:MCE family protein [Mycolicibacterium peregrinum]|uniref:MCE family protein n=1 Tax=Mycolicibacterium peregrinum TaxID=43304 RepID=UPI00265F0CB7|nr:MCE family protein [Mycolicibacterium peregrinum]